MPKLAQRVDRGIALSFHDLGTRRGWVVSTTPRPLYLRNKPGTHCTGSWVGPRAGLDGCEKSRPHRDYFLYSNSIINTDSTCGHHVLLCSVFAQLLEHPSVVEMNCVGRSMSIDPRTVQPVASRYTD
jgi:hypothetical protein